jgi:hypothetical protein
MNQPKPTLWCDRFLMRAGEIALAMHAAGIPAFSTEQQTGYALSARHDYPYIQIEFYASHISHPWWTGTPSEWADHDLLLDRYRTALEAAGLPVRRFVEGSGESVLRVEVT